MKLLIFLLLFTIALSANAQPDKNKILRCFDAYDYYPDSTIKTAYHLKNGKYDKYAVEFDTAGVPAIIGKYTKGKKTGNWLYRNGAVEHYKKGETDGLIAIPGCGTGAVKAKNEFRALYEKLTNCNE